MVAHTFRISISIVTGLILLSALTASAQGIRAGVEKLAEQIIQAAPEGKRLRVAVADFPDLQNVTSDLGRYIANRLTTRLIQSPKFFVVERQRLGQVLKELKFNMSDLVDPAKAKHLGQIAGVDALVLGTISDLGNQVDFDARVIEVDTSQMLLSATVTISKDQVVNDLLNRGRQSSIISSPPNSQPSIKPKQPTEPAAPALASVSQALKDSAALLARRAEKGSHSVGEIKGWLVEYNALLEEVKFTHKDNPYIGMLKPLRYSGSGRQAIGSVVSASKKLEQLIDAAAQGR